MLDGEWLFLDAAGARLFRIGDAIVAGQPVGHSVSGRPVQAGCSGRVTAIEYDIERDEVVLAITVLGSRAPQQRPCRCRSGAAISGWRDHHGPASRRATSKAAAC